MTTPLDGANRTKKGVKRKKKSTTEEAEVLLAEERIREIVREEIKYIVANH